MKINYEIWRWFAASYLLCGGLVGLEGDSWGPIAGIVGALICGVFWWFKVPLILPKWMERP